MNWRGLSRAAYGRLRFWARARHMMILGVRVVVLDGASVYLVRHSYVAGWHLPGGGVDAGETAQAAALRELAEETHVVPAGPLALHGVFLNRAFAARDHVCVYVLRASTLGPERAADLEIVERGFFPLDALPATTSGATRRRLAEVLDGVAPAADW